MEWDFQTVKFVACNDHWYLDLEYEITNSTAEEFNLSQQPTEEDSK